MKVRPLSKREKLHQHQPCVRIAAEANQIVIGKDKVFTFDFVIPPKASQADLYETCVKGLVHSIFEGYNATVFAYGQTVNTYLYHTTSIQLAHKTRHINLKKFKREFLFLFVVVRALAKRTQSAEARRVPASTASFRAQSTRCSS